MQSPNITLSLTFHFCQSSCMKCFAYDPATKHLYVQFASGGKYTYFDVHPEAYQAMLSEESVGVSFNAWVKMEGCQCVKGWVTREIIYTPLV